MDNEHLWLAVIAGGQGTRLFPISHPACPKQFCKLDDRNHFIQATIDNYLSVGVKPTHVMVLVTNETQRQLAMEQCLPRGVLSQNIIMESPDLGYPGCMARATELIYEIDREAIVIETPSDQYLERGEAFINTIAVATEVASSGSFVIVGVKVNDLVTATGCGHVIYDESAGPYLTVGNFLKGFDVLDKSRCFTVTDFIEKPNLKVADRIMRQGNSACNTGINVWSAEAFHDVMSGRSCIGISTDEFMKMLGPLKVAVGNFIWRDCGTLKSLYEISKKTPNHKNASLGGGTFERINCRGSLLYAAEGMELRVSGAENDAIVFNSVDGHPVVVVAKLKESQKIKELANDYFAHEDILSEDFALGARNNTVLGSNVSDELVVGFVGVSNYAIYVHRRPDGMLEAVVSQQLKPPKA